MASVVNGFLIPHEVGGLYEREGRRPPVRAWWGLWMLAPIPLSLIPLFGALASSLDDLNLETETAEDFVFLSGELSTGLLIASAGILVVSLAAALIWYLPVQRALNTFWAGKAPRRPE